MKEYARDVNRDQAPAQAKVRPHFLWFLSCVVLVAAFIILRSPSVAASDSFYHFTQARVYREMGAGTQQFPWMEHSVVGKNGSDLWWVFHLLLLPLTFVPDPILGIRLSAITVLTVLLLLFGWLMQRERVPLAYVWPFLLLFGAPEEVYRFSMVRPQGLTVVFAALLLSFLNKGRLWQIFTCGLVLSWIHPNLFWVVPVVTGVFFVTRGIVERAWNVPSLLAANGGALVALLLHPAPGEFLRLLSVQLVGLAQVRWAHIPIEPATEMRPVPFLYAPQRLGTLLFLWPVSIAGYVYRSSIIQRQPAAARPEIPGSPSPQTLLWSSLVLSSLFGITALTLAARAADLWTGFTVLFLALLCKQIADNPARIPPASLLLFGRRVGVLPVALATTLVIATSISLVHNAESMKKVGHNPQRVERAAQWLAENTPVGSSVLQIRWDLFPELFFWNRHNHYSGGGFDAIFSYADNPENYWAIDQLGSDAGIMHVNLSRPGISEHLMDTHDFLAYRLRVPYLLLDKAAVPQLFGYTRIDPRYRLVYEDRDFGIFQIL